MLNSKQMPRYDKLMYWAFLLGFMGLLIGYGLIYWYPQQPDGDITALKQFELQYGNDSRHHIHDAFWFNLSGALFAWGCLLHAVRHFVLLINSHTSPHLSSNALREWMLLLMWGGVLVMWSGWAWNQTRDWQGTLFLEAGLATPIGIDKKPMVTFERFLIPPAADGVGRALHLDLLVNRTRYQISEITPYHRLGWTLKPHWYGVTVKSNLFTQPLFFGKSGTIQASIEEDSDVAVTVTTNPLTVESIPPLPDLQVAYHAIIQARFAPGVPLQQLGALIIFVSIISIAIFDFRFQISDFRFQTRNEN